MKKLLFFILLLSSPIFAQTDGVAQYKKTSVMMPMRDGVKLYTVILSPVNAQKSVPILLRRTPYGAAMSIPDDTTFNTNLLGSKTANEGYIFIHQDIRGKYKSEGTMQIHQPITHTTEKGTIDESTDTWDTVDWLVKNLPNNNGKVGIYGISYGGWLALVGAVDPHPALKAS